MITRGIVEEVIDRYTVRVRLPLLDGTPSSKMSTKTNQLNVASICTLPSCDMNVRVGDVVFVGFEDVGERRAFIFGYLYRNAMTNTYCDMMVNSLETLGRTQLCSNTSIGDVSANEISCLSGVTSNIQKQINRLETMITTLESRISSGTPNTDVEEE